MFSNNKPMESFKVLKSNLMVFSCNEIIDMSVTRIDMFMYANDELSHWYLEKYENQQTFGIDSVVCVCVWVGNLWVELANILKPEQNVCHFVADIFKCIFSNKNLCLD